MRRKIDWWKWIERFGFDSNVSFERELGRLEDEIATLRGEEIVALDEFFRTRVLEALDAKSYYAAQSVTSGFGKLDFIGVVWWVVLQGRNIFKATLKNPLILGGGVPVAGHAIKNHFPTMISSAFKRSTGKEFDRGGETNQLFGAQVGMMAYFWGEKLRALRADSEYQEHRKRFWNDEIANAGLRRREEKLLNAFGKRAEKGDRSALAILGQAYFSGKGAPRDVEKGLKYLEQAADLGDYPSQLTLAAAFYEGSGVERDMKRALKWIEKSATGGYTDMMCLLGEIYRTGEAGEKDLKAASGGFQRRLKRVAKRR
jgi:hypothetical protein